MEIIMNLHGPHLFYADKSILDHVKELRAISNTNFKNKYTAEEEAKIRKNADKDLISLMHILSIQN